MSLSPTNSTNESRAQRGPGKGTFGNASLLARLLRPGKEPLPFPVPCPDEEEVQYLLAPGGGTLRRRNAQGLRRSLSEARKLAVPIAVSVLRPVSSGPDGVRVEGGALLTSRVLRRVCGPCDSAHFYVATLGGALDERVAALNAARPLEAYLLDLVASHLAEAMAEALWNAFRRELEPGRGATLRYSPGYCDWPLSDQSVIFSLLDARPAGVTLTPHMMMKPRKSVSGLVGLGPAEAVSRTANACLECPNLRCEHRRIP